MLILTVKVYFLCIAIYRIYIILIFLILASLYCFISGDFTSEYVTKLSRDYKSDIVCMRLLGQPVVFLNSHDLIKEVFAKQTNVVDRLDVNVLQLADPDHRGQYWITISCDFFTLQIR